MRAELISVCQLFLVPSAIMFAALGVAEVVCGRFTSGGLVSRFSRHRLYAASSV